MLKEVALLLVTNLVFAIGFGLLKQPYILGYIATGIFLGPFLRMLDQNMLIAMLGEFGMLMLLFIIGIEFDLCKFRKNWKQSCLFVFLQLGFSLILSAILRYAFGLLTEVSVLVAFLLTLSSTAVVAKLLNQMGEFNTRNGSFIISVLIMQDLLLVPMMLVLKGFNTNIAINNIFLNVMLATAILTGLIFYLGNTDKRLLRPIKKVFQGSQEIVTLAGAAICFGLAAVSSALGFSAAYGAFLGGLILGSFANHREILQVALPLSSILVMMFFVSIGAQVHLNYVIAHWHILLLASSALFLGKFFMNYVAMRLIRFNARRSIFIAAMLSQASEFSFILIDIVSAGKLLTDEQRALLNILVVISLTFGAFLPIAARAWYKFVINYKKNGLKN